MTLDPQLAQRLQSLFAPLHGAGAPIPMPLRSSLSKKLGKLAPNVVPGGKQVNAATASHFMTAAVEIWLRAVHSFLVSAALTDSSPMWAIVSGYYSSHYSVRGFAHLFGYFQLFQLKRAVQLEEANGAFVCNFASKSGNQGEHKIYWGYLKKNDLFKNDAFFTENIPDIELSDVRHRNTANYSDHLNIYPPFSPPSEDDLRDRIDALSKLPLSGPPLPRFSKFPDVDYVQLIAYHRIVRFRKLLDEALGNKNSFWNEHRSPSFVQGYMNFQLAEVSGLTVI